MPIDPMAPEGGDPAAPIMEPDLEGEVLSTSGKKELPKGGEI